MNTVRVSLLLLFMIALTNTSYAGVCADKGQADAECDYISGVDTLYYLHPFIEQNGGLRVAFFFSRE